MRAVAFCLTLLIGPGEAMAAATGGPGAGGDPAQTGNSGKGAPLYRLPEGDDYQRAMQCLTQAVYYEAASEPRAGQEAVAQVVLNRVRHPAFPKSVCGVVFEGSWRATGCQFTFTCDGSLARRPLASRWAQAQAVAADALGGRLEDEVGDSTHYHASWMTPYWSASMAVTARIGGHVFYRMAGADGLPEAFTGSYVRAEPTTPEPLAAEASDTGRLRRGPVRLSRPRRAVAEPSTFSAWGLRIATITPTRRALEVQGEP